jgi:hypothetical protein
MNTTGWRRRRKVRSMSTRRMRPEQVVKGEGGNGIWDKSGQGKFEELWEEEDEAAYQLLEGEYVGAARDTGQGTRYNPTNISIQLLPPPISVLHARGWRSCCD